MSPFTGTIDPLSRVFNWGLNIRAPNVLYQVKHSKFVQITRKQRRLRRAWRSVRVGKFWGATRGLEAATSFVVVSSR